VRASEVRALLAEVRETHAADPRVLALADVAERAMTALLARPTLEEALRAVDGVAGGFLTENMRWRLRNLYAQKESER